MTAERKMSNGEWANLAKKNTKKGAMVGQSRYCNALVMVNVRSNREFRFDQPLVNNSADAF